MLDGCTISAVRFPSFLAFLLFCNDFPSILSTHTQIYTEYISFCLSLRRWWKKYGGFIRVCSSFISARTKSGTVVRHRPARTWNATEKKIYISGTGDGLAGSVFRRLWMWRGRTIQSLPFPGSVVLSVCQEMELSFYFTLLQFPFRPLCAPHPSMCLGNPATPPVLHRWLMVFPLPRAHQPATRKRAKSESKMMFGRMLCIIGRQKFYLLEALVRKARCMGKCAMEHRSNEQGCDAINAQQARGNGFTYS